MFDDVFLCDQLNGHAFYDDEEDSYCVSKYDVSQNPRYYNGPVTTYTIYGILQKETDKAGLYKLIRIENKKYIVDQEKWLPYSQISVDNISEFDKKSTTFNTDFVVSGYENLDRIQIPSWLFNKLFRENHKTTVFYTKQIK